MKQDTRPGARTDRVSLYSLLRGLGKRYLQRPSRQQEYYCKGRIRPEGEKGGGKRPRPGLAPDISTSRNSKESQKVAVSRAKGSRTPYLLLACNFRRKKGVSFVKKKKHRKTGNDVMPRVAYVRSHVCIFQRQVIKNSSKRRSKRHERISRAEKGEAEKGQKAAGRETMSQQSYGHAEDDVLTPKHGTSYIPSHQKFVY